MKNKEKIPTNDFLNCSPEDKTLSVVMVLLIIFAPTVFYRSVSYTFYLPQLTVFWILGLLVVLILFYKTLATGMVYKLPTTLFATLLFFSLGLVLVSILSHQSWVSFTGLTARGAGAISYLICLTIFYSVFQLGQKIRLKFIVNSLIFVHVLVAVYAILQKSDLDPISWGSGANIVGNQVFSLLGNSNFSAGYLVSTYPLLVWLALSSSARTNIRTFAGACIGISSIALVYLDSSAGDIAVIVSIFPLLYWTFTHYYKKFLTALLITFPFAISFLLPIAIAQDGLRLAFLLVGATTVSAYFGDSLDRKSEDIEHSRKISKKNFIISSVMVLFSVFIVFLFLLRDRINNEFQSGLDQRLEFWKVAIKVFSLNPIFGTGLETYLSNFTTHRSLTHAVKWPGVFADSPHSVPLGFLSDGGLILTVGYLGVISVVFYYGIHAVKKAESPSQVIFYLAVLASWFSYQLQSIVSIATPGLIYVQWILAGILTVGGASEVNSVRVFRLIPKLSRKNKKNFSYAKPSVLLICLTTFLLLIGPVTAPLRANKAAFESQGYFSTGDYLNAEEKLSKAVKLQPNVPSYFSMRGIVLEYTARPSSAFLDFERAASLSPGQTASAIEAAHSAIRMGRIDRAEYWYEKALSADPYNASVLMELVGFYASNGRREDALEILGFFETLKSPQVALWSYAAKIYDFFEEHNRAEFARSCADEVREIVRAPCKL